MTQEERIRRMLEGFVGDPPDTEHQEGFLAAVIVIASEIMGFDPRDPLLMQAENIMNSGPEAIKTVEKVRPTLTIVRWPRS